MKKFIINTFSVLFWIIIWEIIYLIVDAKFLISSPLNVMMNVVRLLCIFSTYEILFWSMLRIISGFFAAIITGIILGILVSTNKKIIKPIVDMFMNIVKIVPIVSFVILALVYMSHNIIVPFISFLMVLPIIYYTTYSSITKCDNKLIEMAKVYEYSLYDKIKYVYLNNAKENILASLKASLGFAFKSGITAEVLVIPEFSIGEMLYTSKVYLDGLTLISFTLLLVVLSIMVEKLIIVSLKRSLLNYK